MKLNIETHFDSMSFFQCSKSAQDDKTLYVYKFWLKKLSDPVSSMLIYFWYIYCFSKQRKWSKNVGNQVWINLPYFILIIYALASVSKFTTCSLYMYIFFSYSWTVFSWNICPSFQSHVHVCSSSCQNEKKKPTKHMQCRLYHWILNWNRNQIPVTIKKNKMK